MSVFRCDKGHREMPLAVSRFHFNVSCLETAELQGRFISMAAISKIILIGNLDKRHEDLKELLIHN